MTSQASEVRQVRSRSGEALQKAVRRTSLIARGVEREFWTGVLISMRWGKIRLRDFHSAFDQMVTRVEYRAGRSAETAQSQLQRAASASSTAGGGSNGGDTQRERTRGASAPAF